MVTLEDKLSKETAEVAALKEQLDEAASVEKALKVLITFFDCVKSYLFLKNQKLKKP